MTRYAQGTSVAEDRTRLEIERVLRRYGADQFASAWEVVEPGTSVHALAFRLGGRSVRMQLPMPGRDDVEFTRTPTGRPRSAAAAAEEYEKEVRRRWRALLLVLKAKLTAVQDGISTLEREFLADMVTADGRTVSEVMRPHLEAGGPLSLDGYGRRELSR